MNTIFDTHKSTPIELYNNEGLKIQISTFMATTSIISVQNSSPDIQVCFIDNYNGAHNIPLSQKEGDDVVQYPIHHGYNYTIYLHRNTPGIPVYCIKTIKLTASHSWAITEY